MESDAWVARHDALCSGGPAHHPECPFARTFARTPDQGPCDAPWLPDEYQPAPPPPGFEDPEPPADWLMAWMSGWMAGYATGHEHGHQDGEAEYEATLQAALQPMRRAAAHGLDMMVARRAWENQRRADHGQPPLTGPLERGGDREPYGGGGGQDE